MITRPRLKRILSDFRLAISPASVDILAAGDAVWADAKAAWGSDFADLEPLVDDADLLEIGAGDMRMLALLLTAEPDRVGARSAVGLGMDGQTALEEDTSRLIRQFGDRLQWHSGSRIFDALESSTFDMILCRDWQAWFAEAGMEAGLARVYDLLRPGGEFLVNVDCADLADLSATGKGYGVMTPSSWMMAFQRAGFEIGQVRRSLRMLESAGMAQTVLPLSSDDERSTARLRCRLVRPWEAWELNGLRSVDQGSVS